MSSILVIKEKYGDRYFVINTFEDQAKVAFKVLKQRAADGYWFPSLADLDAQRERFFNKLGEVPYAELTEAEIEALPDSVKLAVQNFRAAYNKKISAFEVEQKYDREFAENLQRLLESDDPEVTFVQRNGREASLAWDLLNLRSDYQYEGFSLESSEDY